MRPLQVVFYGGTGRGEMAAEASLAGALAAFRTWAGESARFTVLTHHVPSQRRLLPDPALTLRPLRASSVLNPLLWLSSADVLVLTGVLEDPGFGLPSASMTAAAALVAAASLRRLKVVVFGAELHFATTPTWLRRVLAGADVVLLPDAEAVVRATRAGLSRELLAGLDPAFALPLPPAEHTQTVLARHELNPRRPLLIFALEALFTPPRGKTRKPEEDDDDPTRHPHRHALHELAGVFDSLAEREEAQLAIWVPRRQDLAFAQELRDVLHTRHRARLVPAYEEPTEDSLALFRAARYVVTSRPEAVAMALPFARPLVGLATGEALPALMRELGLSDYCLPYLAPGGHHPLTYRLREQVSAALTAATADTALPGMLEGAYARLLKRRDAALALVPAAWRR